MIVNALQFKDNEWSGGYVLNTQDGVLYKTHIKFVDENTLRLHEYDWFLRKYHGYTTFGRNTYWYRVRDDI